MISDRRIVVRSHETSEVLKIVPESMIDNKSAILGPTLVLQNSFLTIFTMVVSLTITEK